ncbi:MAG: Uma2 family endonuclease [Anaerolineae bacterium]|nr:Uma2 family endonuclease [Anaerolineae bacterium]
MATLERTRVMTAEEFDAYADLPENADKLLEFIGGEIVEVPSNRFASKISGIFFGEIYIFLKQNPIGHLTGEAGGFRVFGERYAPDVGFTRKENQSEVATEGYDPVPPDLAIEVDFPSTPQSKDRLRIKVGNYLAAGATVWLTFPETQTIEVYAPGRPVQLLGINDTLDGGDVLPGFSLPVKAIFIDPLPTHSE